MLAVVIDPIVCHSVIGWMFPECWGIAVMSALPLAVAVALGCASLVRRRVAVR